MKHILISTTFVFSAAACGGSDLEPGAGDDPGTGTATLFIDGSVRADARISNARTPTEFDTELSVRITLNDQGVTDAIVKVTSISGEFALTYSGERGRWEGSAPGYDEVYILDVTSGEHTVTGVRVDGPDIHTFTSPAPGATIDTTQPLEIRWSGDNEAESTAIRAEELDWVSIPDLGVYMLSAGAMKAEREQARTNELWLSRTNRVTPTGAVAGSELSVRIENSIEVVAQPNPAL